MIQLPLAAGSSPYHTKGLTYRNLLAHVERTVRGGAATLRRSLPDELRTFVDQPFLAGSWYDFLPVVPLSEMGAQLAGLDEAQWLRAASRAAAEEQANGLYRFLLSMVSDESIVLWVPRLTERYFDFGAITSERVAPGHIRLVRTGTPTFALDWYRICAPEYVGAAIDLARKQKRPVRIESRVTGRTEDPLTRLELATLQFECFV